MIITYTNHKDQTYTLYQGRTKTGKPRYYFGREGQGQGEPVIAIPPGYTISESVNGVVSLVKDRPSLIQPEEVKAIENAISQHPEARRDRAVAKQNHIEVYENIGPNFNEIYGRLQPLFGLSSTDKTGLLAEEERFARYAPVLRFILREPTTRVFGAERMCYLASIDGWLLLGQTGLIAVLAQALIPTLGTEKFYDLW
jgi:hypothetical protein